MAQLIVPAGYKSRQSIRETEIAIKQTKDFFERELARQLNLTRVSAPLFVRPETGLNDNLNGVERPVRFGIREQNDTEVEVVHSLAKWKRMALKRYGFTAGEGLYTDMSAIRGDEDTDNLHSLYVDQWDWEKILGSGERNEETLRTVVRRVYAALRTTEEYLAGIYPSFGRILPEEISFVTTQELEDRWPQQTTKERENLIAQEKGAVFLMQIGGALKSGQKHDGRAPDYDDWSLNGDIIVNYPVLELALELSSMGIRVNAESLRRQLKISRCEDRAALPFQKSLLNGKLPDTIGGGIGQSRICMFFLRKAHIGEVQASVWPEDTVREAEKAGLQLL